jgi:hypothetical protein
MKRRIRLGISAVLLTLPMVGCQQPEERRIAQLEPYLGGRPGPLRPLDKPLAQRPRPRAPVGGEAGWVPRGGINNRWKCIVIHHSASDKSTPAGMRDWHMRGRGWDELGYHFVIGNGVRYPDGKVFVGNRWAKQMHGAHCKTKDGFYNQHGIGICLIGDFEHKQPTRAQTRSLAKLMSFLSAKCGIPRNKILTHGGVTHQTACPGRHFKLSPVLQEMSTQTASAASD